MVDPDERSQLTFIAGLLMQAHLTSGRDDVNASAELRAAVGAVAAASGRRFDDAWAGVRELVSVPMTFTATLNHPVTGANVVAVPYLGLEPPVRLRVPDRDGSIQVYRLAGQSEWPAAAEFDFDPGQSA